MQVSMAWLPPKAGSLCRMRSPSWISPSKNLATDFMAGINEPRWIGMSCPCRIISGRALKSAVEESCARLNTEERAVFSSASVISRWVVSSTPRTTDKVMGSTVGRALRAGAAWAFAFETGAALAAGFFVLAFGLALPLALFVGLGIRVLARMLGEARSLGGGRRVRL